MTETIEKTTYETPYKRDKVITPEIVSTDSDEDILTDMDLILDIKEMSKFSALVKRDYWEPSEYVENRTYTTNLEKYSENKWRPSKYTVKITNPNLNSKQTQKPKTLIQRLFSFLK